ncbi:MAG: hypothetical protein QOE83_1113 [Actinomycetota bacterium]|nr:hypothetical protein [Actinomycetota bacterium]
MDEQRKIVTVVFTDVTGSTAMGEQLDPETLRGIMGRYFDAMQAVIEHHGGIVEKFIGDAVMAVFGVPVLREDDSLRAVRAAIEMRETLKALNERLQAEHDVSILTRTGVNTGEVVAGDVAARERFVTGDTVNVAARLEQAAAPGEILLGVSTHTLTRDAVEVEAVEPLALKGKSEPVPAFRLISIRRAAAGRERHLDAPMVGRARQLRTLRDAYEAAAVDKACQLFTVLGSPGVGKSRLIEEFVSGVEGAQVHRGHCLSYGDGITFWAIEELVRSMVSADQPAPPEDAVGALRASLVGAEEAEAIAGALAGLVGLSPEPSTQQDGFWALRTFLQYRAMESPLVLVLDDIHWAEPTLLDLVEYLVDSTREAPILFLCSARPELLDERPNWGGGKANSISILLEPLSAADSELLVDGLLGGALPDGARERIASAAEGNPLFVEEMLAMLLDDGLIRKEGEDWVVTQDLSNVAVPATIQTLIAARLDRLGRDERTVMDRGSIEGKLFHVGSVTALAPEMSEGTIREPIRSLVRKEMIRPERAEFTGDEAFRFRHQLIRDTSYDSLPKQTRADLHERLARWLGARSDEPAGLDAIIAYHFERAHSYRVELGSSGPEVDALAAEAAVAYSRAGRAALAHGDPLGGVQLLRRAVELTGPAANEEELETQLRLGTGLTVTGAFAEADEVFSGLAKQARALGAERMELHARIGALNVRDRLDTDLTDTAFIAESEELQAALIASGDFAGASAAILARLNWLPRDIAPGVAAEAAALARRAGDEAREIEALVWRIIVGFWGSIPASEGIQECEDLLYRDALDRSQQGTTLNILGALLGMVGRFDEGRALLSRAKTMLEELGGASAVPTFGGFLLEDFAGDFRRAENILRAGTEGLARLGEKNRLSTIAALLAWHLAMRNEAAEAEHYLEVSREAVSPDDVDTFAAAAAASAVMALNVGDIAAATEAAGSAVEYMRERRAPWQEGIFLLLVADTLEAAGDTQGATDALTTALDRFEAKGLLPLVARTRARLDRLGTA